MTSQTLNSTRSNIDLQEDWWVEKSRKNFLAYRMYVRYGVFKDGWFIVDLCRQLQQFYIDYKAGKRPVLIINTPPQHGKSWSIMDFVSWVIGLDPTLRIIFASYAERLGKRCNAALQRTFTMPKYGKIFPKLSITKDAQSVKYIKAKANSELIEFFEGDHLKGEVGYFRNTTVNGSITGDSMDIGIIDDPVKDRKEAKSPVVSQGVWEWFQDAFDSRLSEFAGVIVIMTRWVTHDLTAKIKEMNPNTKICNYQAISTKEELNRGEGEALFPELKSLEFLTAKKGRTTPESWESLYQGNPTITGGNKVKDHWWKWWKTGHLPPLKYKFITADTAQKKKTQNDWTDFKAWGYGVDNNLYLIDHLRAKFEAPELRKEAEIFYRKHDTKRKKVGDPILRGMWIEDKSSGTGLIQELRAKKLKVKEVPRSVDKITRCEDAAPEIEAGRVYLNVDIPDVGNTTKEAREFPNSEFDDDFDNVMLGIEVAFINKKLSSGLKAAMEADN